MQVLSASMIWVVLHYIRNVKLNISQWHELLQRFLKEIPLKLSAGQFFIIHDANECRHTARLSNCYQEAGHLSFTEKFGQQHHITLTHKADITAFTLLQLAFITHIEFSGWNIAASASHTRTLWFSKTGCHRNNRLDMLKWMTNPVCDIHAAVSMLYTADTAPLR